MVWFGDHAFFRPFEPKIGDAVIALHFAAPGDDDPACCQPGMGIERALDVSHAQRQHRGIAAPCEHRLRGHGSGKAFRAPGQDAPSDMNGPTEAVRQLDRRFMLIIAARQAVNIAIEWHESDCELNDYQCDDRFNQQARINGEAAQLPWNLCALGHTTC